MPALADISVPDLAGSLAIVTGANSGIGLETTRRLAQAGAEVVLAVRNPERGQRALADVSASAPSASVSVELLDLGSLDSVAAFAERMVRRGQPVHRLINNAGVMAVPTRHTTADGFELQLGSNYLGHFALTGRLLPLLRQAAAPRVISLSSGVAHFGVIDFADLQAERHYSSWRAYAQSKLAMLLFALELQRRSARAGWGIQSLAAHPGSTRTNLQTSGPNLGRPRTGAGRAGLVMSLPGFGQEASRGVLPTIYAATSPHAAGGEYYGPNGFLELVGMPAPARLPKRARDEGVAERLWAVSEQLTGVSFAAPAATLPAGAVSA